MKNIIYQGTIASARENGKDALPTQVIVTEEVNCYILWLRDADGSDRFLREYSPVSTYRRAEALEVATDLRQRLRHVFKESMHRSLESQQRLAELIERARGLS